MTYKNILLSTALILPLAIAAHQAEATTVTGSSTSTFSNLSSCDNSGGSQDCRITTSSGNPQVQWGSTSNFNDFVNPSTLTAISPLSFTGNTNTTLTIAQLNWFNSPTVAQDDLASFDVHWNLAVAFTSPPGSTGDSQTFDLTITNPLNPPGDHIMDLTLADLSSLVFTLPGVTVSNLQYHVTDGSGAGTTTLTCTAGNCDWENDESNNATLTITANFASTAVPEPASLALLGTALVGLGAIRRRRRTAA